MLTGCCSPSSSSSAYCCCCCYYCCCYCMKAGPKTEIYMKINLLYGKQQQLQQLKRQRQFKNKTTQLKLKLKFQLKLKTYASYASSSFTLLAPILFPFFCSPLSLSTSLSTFESPIILYNFEIRAHHQPISKSLALLLALLLPLSLPLSLFLSLFLLFHSLSMCICGHGLLPVV